MKRIEELADIDLYNAEGVFAYLKELRQIYRAIGSEVEFSSEALKVALGTVGGVIPSLSSVDARMKAKRTTAPLRRIVTVNDFCAVQVVKTGELFRINYSEEHERSGRTRKPSKQFQF